MPVSFEIGVIVIIRSIILTLNQTNQSALSKNIILAFKVSDGENITDYTGQLYPRQFTMSSINGTLKSANGNITNHITNSTIDNSIFQY